MQEQEKIEMLKTLKEGRDWSEKLIENCNSIKDEVQKQKEMDKMFFMAQSVLASFIFNAELSGQDPRQEISALSQAVWHEYRCIATAYKEQSEKSPSPT